MNYTMSINEPPVLDFIRLQMLRWIGLVMWMEEHKSPKRTLQGKWIEETEKQIKEGICWEEGIAEYARKLGIRN